MVWLGLGEETMCVCVFSEFRDGHISAWAEGNGPVEEQNQWGC